MTSCYKTTFVFVIIKSLNLSKACGDIMELVCCLHLHLVASPFFLKHTHINIIYIEREREREIDIYTQIFLYH